MTHGMGLDGLEPMPRCLAPEENGPVAKQEMYLSGEQEHTVTLPSHPRGKRCADTFTEMFGDSHLAVHTMELNFSQEHG